MKDRLCPSVHLHISSPKLLNVT